MQNCEQVEHVLCTLDQMYWVSAVLKAFFVLKYISMKPGEMRAGLGIFVPGGLALGACQPQPKAHIYTSCWLPFLGMDSRHYKSLISHWKLAHSVLA